MVVKFPETVILEEETNNLLLAAKEEMLAGVRSYLQVAMIQAEEDWMLPEEMMPGLLEIICLGLVKLAHEAVQEGGF